MYKTPLNKLGPFRMRSPIPNLSKPDPLIAACTSSPAPEALVIDHDWGVGFTCPRIIGWFAPAAVDRTGPLILNVISPVSRIVGSPELEGFARLTLLTPISGLSEVKRRCAPAVSERSGPRPRASC